MKKFTFLLVFFMIVFTASSQNSKKLQSDMEKNHQKYLKFEEMIKYIEMQSSNLSQYKSTQATLKLDSFVERSLNLATDKLDYDFKDEYYYNSALQNTSWLNKEWNLISKQWVVTGKTELEFNNEGLMKTMLLYDDDEDSGELTQSGKFMIYYNADKLQDSVFMYSVENEGEPMSLVMKQYSHYNDAKQLITLDIWAYDEEEEVFVLGQTKVNTYYESGKIKNSTINMILGSLEVPLSKTKYEYDGTGKLTSKVNLTSDFETFKMTNTDSTSYEYSPSNKVEIFSKWEGGTWVKKEKTESNYNSDGDVDKDTYSEWENGNWKETERDEYSYGPINFSDIVVPYFFSHSFDFIFVGGMGDLEDTGDISFNKQIIGSVSIENINGEWKETGKTTIYYSGGTSTDIKEIENALFDVYPNPATESVSFRWKENYENLTLVLYQVTGARVMEQITSSGKSVSISDLKNGVYFYKLMDGQKSVKTGKLIKN